MTLDEGKARKARTVNRARLIEQHARGLSIPEIAKSQGVNQSTVWRFLQRTKPEIQALANFQAHRSTFLDQIHAQCVDVQSRILQTLDDGVISALKANEKASLLFATNVVGGTSYDKSRLEKGLSTENHSIVSRMLDERVKSLYAPIKQPKQKQSCKQGAQVEPNIKEIISA